MLNTKKTKAQIVRLLNKYNDAYYNGEALVSDDVYDELKEQLAALDPTHKLLTSVGSRVSEGKAKVTLPVYMGSLDKIKSNEKELTKFLDKWKDVSDFYISDKVDGISALLYISSGVRKLFSRGNGTVGQDISHLLKYIKGIPSNLPSDLIVRGELIITTKDYDNMTVNKGANARNTASGIVNSKKNLVNASVLTFLAYNLIEKQEESSKYVTVKNEKDRLNSVLGFNTVEFKKVNRNELAFEYLSNFLNYRRGISKVEIDGLVISCNDTNVIAKNKNPDYAFAFKYFITQDKAEVVVKKVEWKVSKDGLLKPVVIFDPVQVSGTRISRATGFNGDYILTNKIGPGSRIVIIRSGDVIPHIESILSKSEPDMPDVKFTWTGKDIKVAGNEKKSEQQLQELVNFFNIIDIKGLGPGMIKKIFDAGYETPVSVFKMKMEQFLNIQGFSNKSELFKEIQNKIKDEDCITLMHASNKFGKGFGSKKLETIIKGLDRKDKTYIPTFDEVMKVKGVSEVTANNFISGMNEFKTFLKEMGNITSCSKTNAKTTPPSSPKNTRWTDQVVVFTGVRNKALEKVITEGGGKVTTSISKKTTLVLTNDANASSEKLNKAKDLGIKIEDIKKYL